VTMAPSKPSRAAPASAGGDPRKSERLGKAFVQKNIEVPPDLQALRRDFVARRVHALGPRPLYELLRELASGADLLTRLEAYARLDPALTAALGGSALQSLFAALDGSRA
jgi:hypothetical protein